MDRQELKELTKKISGRNFDEEKFNESVKKMDEPDVEKSEDEGAELQRVDSKKFSQQSQPIHDDIDNKLYLSSKNIDIYPKVKIGNTFDYIFMRMPKHTELFKMNWHDCVNTIEFHNQQSQLTKTSTQNTGARFEQIWFADNSDRTEDYFYNFKKDNPSKKAILDHFKSNQNSKLSLIYKFILNDETDILNLEHLDVINSSLTNIPLTTKSLFTFFNKEYRTIYNSESKLNFSSKFSDNDTEFCKLIINFVFGGLTVDEQIKFLEDLKAIESVWEKKILISDDLFNLDKKKEFFEAFPFTTYDGNRKFWIQDIQELLSNSIKLDKTQKNQRLSIMFFDMIALFSLFSGFIYSHGLIIPGYYYPNIPSSWKIEDNKEIAMVNIGKVIAKELFICNGVHIDDFLNSYINLKDEEGNYINGKMKEFIELRNKETKIFGNKKKYKKYKYKSKTRKPKKKTRKLKTKKKTKRTKTRKSKKNRKK
jgi:hypothetical protein